MTTGTDPRHDDDLRRWISIAVAEAPSADPVAIEGLVTGGPKTAGRSRKVVVAAAALLLLGFGSTAFFLARGGPADEPVRSGPAGSTGSSTTSATPTTSVVGEWRDRDPGEVPGIDQALALIGQGATATVAHTLGSTTKVPIEADGFSAGLTITQRDHADVPPADPEQPTPSRVDGYAVTVAPLGDDGTVVDVVDDRNVTVPSSNVGVSVMILLPADEVERLWGDPASFGARVAMPLLDGWNPGATDPAADLPGLIRTAGAAACCTETADGTRFTLEDGTETTLRWEHLDLNSPQDPRLGLSDASAVPLEDGGIVEHGTDAGHAVVRLDCGGIRYELRSAARAGVSLLAFAPRLSGSAGCSRPSISAPTECLSLPDDPAACVEDPPPVGD